MGLPSINEKFAEDTFEELKDVKGDRSWHDAIIEEFEVDTE